MDDPVAAGPPAAVDAAAVEIFSDSDDVEAALEAALGESGEAAEEQPVALQPGHHVKQSDDLTAVTDPLGRIDLGSMTKEQRAELNTRVVGLLSGSELDRYEAFRRSSLKKPMQRVMHVVTGVNPKPQDKALIALASVAKSFVGQLVETARILASGQGTSGPLQPSHIHAAYQELIRDGKVEGLPKRHKHL